MTKKSKNKQKKLCKRHAQKPAVSLESKLEDPTTNEALSAMFGGWSKPLHSHYSTKKLH